MCISIYLYIYIYIHTYYNIYFCLRKPLPCNPAAETPLQPLTLHFSSQLFQGSSSLEECAFFTDTGIDIEEASTHMCVCVCVCV